MTAEAVPLASPPPGRTVADVDALPENGLRYELVDGVPHVMTPPKFEHQRAQRRLANQLDDAAPAELAVVEGVGVILAPDQRPIPDLVVLRDADPDLSNFPAEQVLLAAEVVPRSSRSDDRSANPRSTRRQAPRCTCGSSWSRCTSSPTASARTGSTSRPAAPNRDSCSP